MKVVSPEVIMAVFDDSLLVSLLGRVDFLDGTFVRGGAGIPCATALMSIEASDFSSSSFEEIDQSSNGALGNFFWEFPFFNLPVLGGGVGLSDVEVLFFLATLPTLLVRPAGALVGTFTFGFCFTSGVARLSNSFEPSTVSTRTGSDILTRQTKLVEKWQVSPSQQNPSSQPQRSNNLCSSSSDELPQTLIKNKNGEE